MKKKHFYAIVILLLFLAIGIQPALATIFLSDSGWNPDVGDWDPVTLTGTLTQNVSETIQISSSGTSQTNNLTLDGAGHTVTGTGLNTGVLIISKTYVTVQNLNVTGCYDGIYISRDTSSIPSSFILCQITQSPTTLALESASVAIQITTKSTTIQSPTT